MSGFWVKLNYRCFHDSAAPPRGSSRAPPFHLPQRALALGYFDNRPRQAGQPIQARRFRCRVSPGQLAIFVMDEGDAATAAAVLEHVGEARDAPTIGIAFVSVSLTCLSRPARAAHGGVHSWISQVFRCILSAMDEHRISPRRRVLKAGSIQFSGGAIDCAVRNLSKTGAALEVFTPLFIPDRFTLVVPSDQLTRPCHVVWREQRRIGVAFD